MTLLNTCNSSSETPSVSICLHCSYATSEENSATIEDISQTIVAQNNSIGNILSDIENISEVSEKLQKHFEI
jgi:methyl-accepting chemotaxis protein